MSTSRSFRTIRRFLLPKWATEGEGELVGYTLDLVKDAFVERARLGHLARFPQNDPTGQTTAPEDALAAMGRDRRVVRGIFETAPQYAVRLTRWLDDRKRQGNPFMLMQKLAEYTGPGPSFRTVDARGNWYSRSGAGVETSLLKQANWHWSSDGPTARWSRFWVIVYPNGLWSPGPTAHGWGDTAGPNWGAPVGTIGTTATAEQITTLRSIVADWKVAGTRCVNVIIAFDSASFNPASPEPDGLWERWCKYVGGVAVPTRLATARYLDGVS